MRAEMREVRRSQRRLLDGVGAVHRVELRHGARRTGSRSASGSDGRPEQSSPRVVVGPSSSESPAARPSAGVVPRRAGRRALRRTPATRCRRRRRPWCAAANASGSSRSAAVGQRARDGPRRRRARPRPRPRAARPTASRRRAAVEAAARVRRASRTSPRPARRSRVGDAPSRAARPPAASPSRSPGRRPRRPSPRRVRARSRVGCRAACWAGVCSRSNSPPCHGLLDAPRCCSGRAADACSSICEVSIVMPRP